MKKIVSLAVTVIMMFTFTACGVSLDSYKATKSEELQAYADAKGQDNYTVDAWAEICEAVIGGKQAIAAAQNKDEVNAGFVDAKQLVDNVLTIKQEFEIYKSKAIDSLQAYLEERGGSYFFNDENWSAMMQLMDGGKEEIDNAATEYEVDLAVIQAKQAMDLIDEKEDVTGRFYALQEAYDEGLLTRQDLMNIAYYYDYDWKISGSHACWYEGLDEDFMPTAKSPENLNQKIDYVIRKDFLEQHLKALDYYPYSVDRVVVGVYCGTYNNLPAVLMGFDVSYVPDIGKNANDTIGGITFKYGHAGSLGRIFIWKAN